MKLGNLWDSIQLHSTDLKHRRTIHSMWQCVQPHLKTSHLQDGWRRDGGASVEFCRGYASKRRINLGISFGDFSKSSFLWCLRYTPLGCLKISGDLLTKQHFDIFHIFSVINVYGVKIETVWNHTTVDSGRLDDRSLSLDVWMLMLSSCYFALGPGRSWE